MNVKHPPPHFFSFEYLGSSLSRPYSLTLQRCHKNNSNLHDPEQHTLQQQPVPHHCHYNTVPLSIYNVTATTALRREKAPYTNSSFWTLPWGISSPEGCAGKILFPYIYALLPIQDLFQKQQTCLVTDDLELVAIQRFKECVVQVVCGFENSLTKTFYTWFEFLHPGLAPGLRIHLHGLGNSAWTQTQT